MIGSARADITRGGPFDLEARGEGEAIAHEEDFLIAALIVG